MRFDAIFSILLFIAVWSLTPEPVLPQVNPGVCSTLTEEILAATAANCGSLASNSVCAGKPVVAWVLRGSGQVVSTNQSGDQVPLETLQTLYTAPLTPTEWGAAMINVNGDLSLSAPSGSATILAMGDVMVDFSEPLPALRFRTGFDSSNCAQSSSLVAVYPVEGAPIRLNINGTPMRIAALTIFQWHSLNSLTVIVQNGGMVVEGQLEADSGQTLTAVTDNNGSVMVWAAPRSSSAEEVETANRIIRMLSLGIQAEASCENLIHTVSSGETISRIAQRYGSTIAAIANLNDLADASLINIGQILLIPCEDE
jgi:hypothetical protein